MRRATPRSSASVPDEERQVIGQGSPEARSPSRSTTSRRVFGVYQVELRWPDGSTVGAAEFAAREPAALFLLPRGGGRAAGPVTAGEGADGAPFILRAPAPPDPRYLRRRPV